MKHEIMSAWTPAEDKMILQLYRQEGRKWAKIASCLENRTSASVRNRFLRIEKGARLRAQGVSKNRCAACGQQSSSAASCAARVRCPGKRRFFEV